MSSKTVLFSGGEVMDNETFLSELNEAINNLKAGRYEEVYNILVNLSDELCLDIVKNKVENRFNDETKKN